MYSRRDLGKTALAAAPLSARAASRVIGANDRINVGSIGVGGIRAAS